MFNLRTALDFIDCNISFIAHHTLWSVALSKTLSIDELLVWVGFFLTVEATDECYSVKSISPYVWAPPDTCLTVDARPFYLSTSI